jgi:hypothetical protein
MRYRSSRYSPDPTSPHRKLLRPAELADSDDVATVSSFTKFPTLLTSRRSPAARVAHLDSRYRRDHRGSDSRRDARHHRIPRRQSSRRVCWAIASPLPVGLDRTSQLSVEDRQRLLAPCAILPRARGDPAQSTSPCVCRTLTQPRQRQNDRRCRRGAQAAQACLRGRFPYGSLWALRLPKPRSAIGGRPKSPQPEKRDRPPFDQRCHIKRGPDELPRRQRGASSSRRGHPRLRVTAYGSAKT